MVQPNFPQGIFDWGTDRVDELDIDFANDVNGPAAEIESVEATLGVMPQVEKNPINGGNPITYATVDARISAMQQGILPYISLTFGEDFVPNNCGAGTYYGQWNTYDVATDPFNMYNGNDITVPVTGWLHHHHQPGLGLLDHRVPSLLLLVLAAGIQRDRGRAVQQYRVQLLLRSHVALGLRPELSGRMVVAGLRGTADSPDGPQQHHLARYSDCRVQDVSAVREWLPAHPAPGIQRVIQGRLHPEAAGRRAIRVRRC